MADKKQIESKLEDCNIGMKHSVEQLKSLQERITTRTRQLRSDGFPKQYESRDLEILQNDVKDANLVLQELKNDCKEYADAFRSVGSTFGELSKDLSVLATSNFSKFDEDKAEEKTREELEAEARASKAEAQLASLAEQMMKLRELSVMTEESASRAAGAAARAVSQADEAQRQAAAEKEKIEEQMKEEEKKKQEEERLARQKEEQRKKEEERQRLAEERKKQDKLRREEEEKKRQETEDPKHWPSHVYGSTDEATDYLGHCISCIFRTRGRNFRREDVRCSTVNALTSGINVSDYEEVVGNIIHIDPTPDAKFEGAVWLALPYTGTRIGQSKEIMVKQLDSKGKIHYLLARETAIPDQNDARFIETPLRKLEEMTLLPITRLKCDSTRIGVKGGKVSSSGDPRVSLHLSKGSFVRPTDLQQIQHMDLSHLHDLKFRHAMCMPLIGISPMVRWKFQVQPDKPLKVIMPGPTGGGARKRAQTAVGSRGQQSSGRRPSTAWGGKMQREEGPAIDDKVYVMVKSTTGVWQHRPEVKLCHTRDLLSMEIKDVGESLVMLRIQGEPDSSTVVQIAEKVEASFDDRPVMVALRQQTADEANLYIELCPSNRLEKKLLRLKEKGFGGGPNPSQEFFLNEGDQIEMKFRGNVDFEGETVKRFIYHSSLSSAKTYGTVKVLDKFAQHGLQFYRGYLQIWLKRRKSPKETKVTTTFNDEAKEKENDGMEMVTELPVTLDKPSTELTTVSRAPVKFREQGPLTLEYFDELKGYLGDEWKTLGEELGVSKARIQSIISNNAYGGDKYRFILEMLLTWFKGSSAAATNDKVYDLFWSLRNINREDLAQDLYQKNLEFQEESIKRYEYEKMRKSFKAVTDSTAALIKWKDLAQELGVQGDDINQIDEFSSVPLREKATQALQKWREKNHTKATRQRLIKILRKMNLVEAAENVTRLR